MIFTGQRIVWGVPDVIKPILGQNGNKMKVRLRKKREGRVFIKSDSGMSEFIIGIRDDGSWYPAIPIGKNLH